MNYTLMASYSLSKFFSITAVPSFRDSLSHSKQLASYSGNNKLNITQGKEYDNSPHPLPKHNRFHIQFCTFYVLSVCEMMRRNLWPKKINKTGREYIKLLTAGFIV